MADIRARRGVGRRVNDRWSRVDGRSRVDWRSVCLWLLIIFRNRGRVDDRGRVIQHFAMRLVSLDGLILLGLLLIMIVLDWLILLGMLIVLDWLVLVNFFAVRRLISLGLLLMMIVIDWLVLLDWLILLGFLVLDWLVLSARIFLVVRHLFDIIGGISGGWRCIWSGCGIVNGGRGISSDCFSCGDGASQGRGGWVA